MKSKVHMSWSQSQHTAKSYKGKEKRKKTWKSKIRSQPKENKRAKAGILICFLLFSPWGSIINQSCFPRVVGPLHMALGKWFVLSNVHITLFFWATGLLFPAFLAVGVDVWISFNPWNGSRRDVQKCQVWSMNTHIHACGVLTLFFFLYCMREQRSGGRWSHKIQGAELSSHHHRPFWIMMRARRRLLFCSTKLLWS